MSDNGSGTAFAGRSPVRLLIASDVCLYRDSLSEALEQCGRFEVVATVAERAELVDRAREVEPRVVLIDMRMPESEESVRAVRRFCPACRVVALTVPEAGREVIRCSEAGVAALVFRSGSLDELVKAIEGALAGDVSLSPKQTADAVIRLAEGSNHAGNGSDAHLTEREEEIVELIDRGLSNKDIARELGIQLPTVKNHVHNILEKLHVHRRAEAAALLRRGTPPWSLGEGRSTAESN